MFHTRRSSCLSRLFTGLSAPRLSAFFPAVRTRRRPHSSSPGDGCRHRCGREPKAIYLCVPPPGETSSTRRLFTVSSLWGNKKKKRERGRLCFSVPHRHSFAATKEEARSSFPFNTDCPCRSLGRAPTAALLEFTNANKVKLVA